MHARRAADNKGALIRADKLRVQGKLDVAEKALREYLRKHPEHALGWLSLGKTLAARGEVQHAEHAYERAIALDASAFEARVNLGVLFAQRGAIDEALDQYRKALTQKPEHVLSLRNYGGLLRSRGALDEAVEVLSRALRLSPDDPAVHTNLGLALSALGRHTEALVALRRAVQLAPKVSLYHDNLLLLMHYASELSAAEVFAQHKLYGEMVAREVAPTLLGARAPHVGGRLRIGYVSADFRRHSVAFFLEPLLAHRNRDRFEVFAYSSVRKPDEVTVRFQALVDGWRDVALLDDGKVAEKIREDAIDVLVDLSGHTEGNRLGVFARKPAPLSLTYLGYPNTTGLTTIDFRVTDALADPVGTSESLHTESLLRMESGFLCYRPPEPSPEVAPAPSTAGRAPTFGSFNALAKMSDRTLSLWSALLAQVPEAQLLIKQSFLSHPDSRRSFEQRLVAHGIDLTRVELLGHVRDLHGHLAAYARVDVALDTFPYHGTTTTCDALYMGVPVVTLQGDAHVSRVGVSLLSRVGLPDLIAHGAEEYIEIAKNLLRDETRRVAMRASARERVRASGLCDGASAARHFEEAVLRAHASHAEKPSHAPTHERRADASPSVDASLAVPDRAARWLTLDSGLHIVVPRGVDQITSYALQEQGEWFEDEIHFVRRLLRGGETVLDVGANHGVYALAMAQAVGPAGQVVAVEPASHVAARLAASARRNGLLQLAVVQAAISNAEGQARLHTGATSELSSLSATGPSGGGEEVRLTTLDALFSAQKLSQVSFVKLDVEGEELNALAGAGALMEREEPLWMVERKHGEQENRGLLEALRDSGHALFRFIPGLSVLFPHPVGTDSCPFLLNVFAARPARVERLERDGLLAQFSVDEAALPEDASWQEALLSTKLAGRSDLARGFAEPTPGKLRHQAALSRYALSRREGLDATTRALCLRTALELALASVEDPDDLSRFMTVARLAWAWGRRAIAVEALSTALASVNRGKARIDEPFLPPSPRYDGIDPGERLSDWVVSALLEQLERLRSFSGFFDRNPQQALGRLTLLARLGFQSPEMARRLQLVQKR